MKTKSGLTAIRPANAKATKHFASLLIAAQGLGDELIKDGTFDPDQIRRTIVAREDRKDVVPALKANGMSNREIARTLGVSHQTINNELAEDSGKNLPPNGKNLPANKSEPVSEAQRAAEAEKREAADVEREKRETLLRLAEGAYRSAGAFAVSQVRTELIERLGDRKFTNMLTERLRIGVEGAPTIEEMLTGAHELAKILKGVQG